MNNIYPWQVSIWHRLSQQKNNKMPHALLLKGMQGIGKSQFAREFAHFILCSQSTTTYCGKCRSCELVKANTHPDFVMIEPEENSNNIKIDQIRSLIHLLNQTSTQQGYKVAIISPAESMNKAASNALLKTLEEPSGDVVFILVSHCITSVAATIRSRCQSISFPIPSKKITEDWLATELKSLQQAQTFLAMTDYIPLKALQYAKNHDNQCRNLLLEQLLKIAEGKQEPSAAAANFSSLEELIPQKSGTTAFSELLSFWITLIMDVIKIKFRLSQKNLNHPDQYHFLLQICQKVSLKQLFIYYDQVLLAIKQISNQANLNTQLLIEKLFIDWCYR